jgi:hypothetical protein
MASLSPKDRQDEVTGAAMNEGVVNGTMVLATSFGGLYAAMQNAKFRKVRTLKRRLEAIFLRRHIARSQYRSILSPHIHVVLYYCCVLLYQFTNWQSRTAITIMPALFVFALTSEHKMSHRMKEVAEETEHAIKSVEWAERHHRKTQNTVKQMQDEEALRALYRTSILQSGIQLIEGDSLGPHHKMANFVQANPFKCIAGIGIPSVAYIFYGRSQKDLSFQLKILHTRVIGQFAVICTLLGVMGLKELMDRSGRFITEDDVEQRVHLMVTKRKAMMERLEYQATHQPTYMMKKRLEAKKADAS